MKNAAIHIFINFIAEWLIENRSYDANELKGLDLGVGIDRGYFHLGHLGKKILFGDLKEEDQKTINLLSVTIATKIFTNDVKYQKIFQLIGQALVSDKATEKAKKLIARIFMNGKNPDEKTFMLLHDELVYGRTTNAINKTETTNGELKKGSARVNENPMFVKQLKKQQKAHELSKSSTQKKPRKKSKKQSISDGKKSKKRKKLKSNTKNTDKLKIKKDKPKKSKRKKSNKKSTKYLNDGVSGIIIYDNDR